VAIKFRCSAFQHNAPIPKKYTCDGEDISPVFTWENAPQNTKSFAIINDDPDCSGGAWVHWLIYDIPGDKTQLKEGLSRAEILADGSKQGACWGVNEFSRVGYYGPCPPPGKPHRYFFKLYALSKTLGLPPKASKGEVLKAMAGHILEKAEIIGISER